MGMPPRAPGWGGRRCGPRSSRRTAASCGARLISPRSFEALLTRAGPPRFWCSFELRLAFLIRKSICRLNILPEILWKLQGQMLRHGTSLCHGHSAVELRRSGARALLCVKPVKHCLVLLWNSRLFWDAWGCLHNFQAQLSCLLTLTCDLSEELRQAALWSCLQQGSGRGRGHHSHGSCWHLVRLSHHRVIGKGSW